MRYPCVTLLSMIDWNKIGDDEMRTCVIDDLKRRFAEMLTQAEREECLKNESGRGNRARTISEACARYSRRQAAHYQQAIDLLADAPMPPKDEPR